MSHHQQITILLVEDNPGHARLIEKNLRRGGITNGVVKLSNGQQAVDYLFREGQYADLKQTSPLLVLLDLNMPILDGYQVLQRMKEDDRTRLIPVVILTSVDNPSKMAECYKLGCNVYMTKLVGYEKLSQVIRELFAEVSKVKVSLESK